MRNRNVDLNAISLIGDLEGLKRNEDRWKDRINEEAHTVVGENEKMGEREERHGRKA